MPSPFPGMDPHLEAPEIWEDFHADLAGEIRAQLTPHLRPRYYAALTPRVTYEEVTIEETPLAVKEQRIEIRDVGAGTLVTAIEVLSPVNKRRGHEAYETYRRKRRDLLRTSVHLIEVDLLRSGERPPLVTDLPDTPYFVFLSRGDRRPKVEIWPLKLQDPIPVLPVPLRAPDPDVPLDLCLAVRRIYDKAAYDLRIDYRQPPPKPDLSPEDGEWLRKQLQASD